MRIGWEHPESLWLLALLPPLWWIAARRFASLGRWRATLATLARTCVMVAVIAAIAGAQWVWVNDAVTVVYVLDESDSVAGAVREPMLDYASENSRRHRNRLREDRAGMVTFGREARIQAPPWDDDLPRLPPRERTPVASDATDLDAALELAHSAMPADTRRRIVLVTDGNQTRGDAFSAVRRLTEAGIGLDVIPVPVESGPDVLVEKIDLPGEIRLGQPFDARVVITAFGDAEAPGRDDAATAEPIRGRLSVTRTSGGVEELLLDSPVELPPGKSVIPLRHTIERPLPYMFEATFTPDRLADDARPQNNRVSAFANVRGKSRVLLIVPHDRPQPWGWLADQLRDEKIEVVVQASDRTFGSLAELQAFDSVILANIPRISGGGDDAIVTISDAQIEMLVRNTQQLGAGLLMIGGPDAFGAGGWSGTALEKAMPVDFEIKNTLVAAVGALMLVMDISGSMSGEKLEMCKAAVKEAVKMLRPSDMVGLLTFDTEVQEVIPIQPVGGGTHLLPRISRIGVGGGTDLFPAMRRGFADLAGVDAAVKHMIVLTDGMTPDNDFRGLTGRMREAGITVTSVAIGDDADVNLMRTIATLGGGKLYHVLSPRAVPQILMRESRRVARPLIFEDERGLEPQVTLPHPVLQGLGAPPPIFGYVMTTPKDNPLVQTLLTAPLPRSGDYPILAGWQYGLGRTAVLTTDGGQRWATPWRDWPGGGKLYVQLSQWLLRAAGKSGSFSVATSADQGEVQVVVNALDDEFDYRNLLEMTATVLDPELRPVELEIRQTAPGRYAGSFPVDRSGNYFVQIIPEPGAAPLTAGVSVPFSEEYRAREINLPLLRRLHREAEARNSDARLLPMLASGQDEELLASDPFREGLEVGRTVQDAWPWFLLAGCCLFFGDVMVRRIDFGVERLAAWRKRRRRGAEAPPPTERLDRLARAKSQAAESVRRYHPTPTPPGATPPVSADATVAALDSPAPTPGSAGENAGQPAAASYTERLLEAKRRARR